MPRRRRPQPVPVQLVFPFIPDEPAPLDTTLPDEPDGVVWPDNRDPLDPELPWPSESE